MTIVEGCRFESCLLCNMKAYQIRGRLGNQLFQFANIYSDVVAKGGYDYSVNVCPVPLDRLQYKPKIAESEEFLGWLDSEQFFDEKIKDVHVFSMADSALQSGIGKILEELYPEKSRWEK